MPQIGLKGVASSRTHENNDAANRKGSDNIIFPETFALTGSIYVSRLNSLSLLPVPPLIMAGGWQTSDPSRELAATPDMVRYPGRVVTRG